mmetsp:Transcript_38092/g.27687  ORF Transcript_38092/g.27687 Transcript_38092/m.27687 type:complete len:200 (+) Transcript_38092:107-706(+)
MRSKMYQQHAAKSACLNISLGIIGTTFFFYYYSDLKNQEWDCYATKESEIPVSDSDGSAEYHNVSNNFEILMLLAGIFYIYEFIMGIIAIFAIKNLRAAQTAVSMEGCTHCCSIAILIWATIVRFNHYGNTCAGDFFDDGVSKTSVGEPYITKSSRFLYWYVILNWTFYASLCLIACCICCCGVALFGMAASQAQQNAQ